MKFAFNVTMRPQLFRALQEKAFKLGKHWPASPTVLGIHYRELGLGTKVFYVDTERHHMAVSEPPPNIRCNSGEDQENYEQQICNYLSFQGYKVNAFDEFFGMTDECPMHPVADIPHTEPMNHPCTNFGIALNDCMPLWNLCYEKIRDLGFRAGGCSVPTGSLIISIQDTNVRFELTPYSKVQIQEIEDEYGDVEWIEASEFLSWKRILTEHDALVMYAEMLNSADCRDFVESLAIDFNYTSQWVFDSYTTKNSFNDYIFEKMGSLKSSDSHINTRLGTWGDRPCLVVNQILNSEEQAMTVLATAAGGLIKSITVCKVPSPDEISF